MSDGKSKFCSHCGTTVKSDDVFCNNCGASLEEAIEPIGITPIQNQPYSETSYPQQTSVYVPPPKTLNSIAVVAIIFGITSVVFSILPIYFTMFSIVAGIIGIITGIVGGLKSQKKILAYIGLGLSVIGITLWVLAYFGIFRIWGFWW